MKQVPWVTKFQPQTLHSPEFPHQFHFEMGYPVAPNYRLQLSNHTSPFYVDNMQPWQLSECFELKPNTPDLRLWSQNFSHCDLEGSLFDFMNIL